MYNYVGILGYKQILKKAKKAINQASINQRDVQSFTIIVPPIDLQKRFVNFVIQTEKSKLIVQNIKEINEILRAALLQEYFG